MSRRQPHTTDDFFSTHIQGHENNDLISGLRNQVSELKSLSLDIGEEIKEHNRFLKDMDNDFDSTWGTLTNSMNRLKKIASSGNHRYIWYLLLFSLFVFFVIWLIIRF
ncbi:BET1 homolog [Dermatophagoides pteronyssinus]|uniref:BET1 homolog n=2 Tax=Dermatophagoides pteronyssinus TaxID=6956 RepID=A0A6P6YHY1_DERPT|nr:BET1 homolog [Dermatophagoides pteronyssinus]KAH9421125.1 protein transport protein bet1 [Dermatophagoides pteronyssinus]